MIMPIGDDNSDRLTQPVVNYGIIIANVLVFVFFQGMGENEKFTYSFSTVPREIVTGKYKKGKIPKLMDGKASERIAKIIYNRF